MSARRDKDGNPVDSLGLPYKERPLPPQPKRSLLHGTFLVYRSSANTNLAKTFARVRREQRQAGNVVELPLKKEVGK